MHRSDLDHSREILEQVASEKRVSQRSLARDTGIALGLANLLIRQMVREGWVQMVRDPSNRVSYVITAAGLAEKVRRSRAHLAGSVQSYVQARDRIAQRLASLSAERAHETNGSGTRIVFWGANEVAEIGYVCLQGTDLRLVGVVDLLVDRRFFGLPVSSFEALAPGRLGSVAFDMLVVMSFGDEAPIQQQLARIGYPSSGVFWI